ALALVCVCVPVVGLLRTRAGVVVASAFFSPTASLFANLRPSAVTAAIPGLPAMPADLAPLVIGPLLLIFTLTRHPGGFGQILRPIGRWLRGAPSSRPPVTTASVSDPSMGAKARA